MIATTEKSDKYSAPALSKGLDILEFLSSEPEAQKKADIARALNRSISEIFRMLVVLVDREYVAYDAHDERYFLTTKLFELAHKYPPIRRLSAVAAAPMQNLARTVNQSVHMAILRGTDILVISQIDSPGDHITSVRLGARIPLIQTSSGAVLTHSIVESARTSLNKELSIYPAKLRKAYKANCEAARSSGYCECPSMVIEGVINVSVPIHDHSGQIVAALTIPFVKRLTDKGHLSLVQTREALIATGNSVSGMLGGKMAVQA
ncbi:MAG: IclR family transcriptional regulator [Granulosicoccus sp.]